MAFYFHNAPRYVVILGIPLGGKKKKLPGAIGETINQPRRGNEPGHDRDQYLAVNVWRNHGNFY